MSHRIGFILCLALFCCFYTQSLAGSAALNSDRSRINDRRVQDVASYNNAEVRKRDDKQLAVEKKNLALDNDNDDDVDDDDVDDDGLKAVGGLSKDQDDELNANGAKEGEENEETGERARRRRGGRRRGGRRGGRKGGRRGRNARRGLRRHTRSKGNRRG